MEGKQRTSQIEETTEDMPKLLEQQLMVTKFFVPVASGPLIFRPRLSTLLHQSLKHPLTLVSAPAGFGKTTLLSAWAQSLAESDCQVAWVSLDAEDNDPRLFLTYILTALNRQQRELFTPLLIQMQSLQTPRFKYVLTSLINLLTQSTKQFLLILDDYHLITEHQVHTTLAYLVEHLPIQLRIILATRADPPLPLPQLRARKQILEVRTDHLRCTTEEVRAFFHKVMEIQLPDEAIQEITTHTEGWLVGLQLLRLSLPEQANPLALLEQASGNQRYILDYLTEEVLRGQPQEIQTFLLCTSILEQLTASLCDAVLEQTDSELLLQRVEQANLFVVPLDHKRQWYRYHALFAEALCLRLKQTHADLVPILHYRASRWYAEHNQTTKAILHALQSHQWLWVADLIEHTPSLLSYTWGAREYELVLLQELLDQLPVEVMGSRPHLCLACTQILGTVAPSSKLQAWLEAAKATLSASLSRSTDEDVSRLILDPKARQEQENLLGEVIACLGFLESYRGNGQASFLLGQQALSLVSANNFMVRSLVSHAQLLAYHTSAANNVEAAIEIGLQATSLAQEVGATSLAIDVMSATALRMIHAGRLQQAYQLTRQAIHLGTQPQELLLSETGWPFVLQAEILREWNKLDTALSLIQEALSLCKKITSMASLVYRLCGYAVLLRVLLSRDELDTAHVALQEFDRLCLRMSQLISTYHRSYFTTVDQVRLWLARGELEQATRWAKQLEMREEWHGTPFAHEREEVAYVRILLAQILPDQALQRLAPVLQRATTGQRWGHVLEIRLLQALAYQMCHDESQALDTLLEAVHLAEPEGYIRSFVDEGASMASLLCRLREAQRKKGPTPYLDTLLAAFPQQDKTHEVKPMQTVARSMPSPLVDPLSVRELEVLQLLVQGASNQKIAQELVIAIDTVKRHVSHIFSKLDVQNRIQAARRAEELGLLGKEQ